MSEYNFQPGDVVILKSGGQRMTVEAVSDMTGLVQCGWFDAKSKIHRESFQPEALKRPTAGI